ncbi:MAG: hypothetical protein ACK4HE_02435 [Chitinophagaceae bacterium]
MTPFQILFFGFILYVLYKFVTRIVLPIMKATSAVKAQMQAMQAAAQQQYQQQQRYQQQQQHRHHAKSVDTSFTDAEYIDFEEIK